MEGEYTSLSLGSGFQSFMQDTLYFGGDGKKNNAYRGTPPRGIGGMLPPKTLTLWGGVASGGLWGP